MFANLKYLWIVIKHKYFVGMACGLTGVTWRRALVHDWSKFTRAEWSPYVRKFVRGAGRVSAAEWDVALWHHYSHNSHHWQYHVRRAGVGEKAEVMPWMDIREMVADWIGASRGYTGSWDLSDWLLEQWPRMNLHPKTRLRVRMVLMELTSEFIREIPPLLRNVDGAVRDRLPPAQYPWSVEKEE